MTWGAVHRMGTLSRWRRWMATGFFLGCSPRAVGRAYTPDGSSDRRESIRAVGRGYTPDGVSGRGRDGPRRAIKSRRARRRDLRGGQGVGAGGGGAEAGAAGGYGAVVEVGAGGSEQLAGVVPAQAGAGRGGGGEGGAQ